MLWITYALEGVGRKIIFLWNAMLINCLKETNNLIILTLGMASISTEF